MTWFKNLIGGFKWNNENKGIQNKKGNELVALNLAKNSSFNGELVVNVNNTGDKIIAKRNSNLNIISQANIDDKAKDYIQDFDHLKHIKDFIEKGANGTEDIALFVKDLIKNMIYNPDFAERRNIELALDFLKESTTEEKGELIWIYLLPFLGINPEWFKENPSILEAIRIKYPTKDPNLFDYGVSNVFGRFGGKRTLDLKYYSMDENDEKFKEILHDRGGFLSLEDVLKRIPELKGFASQNNWILLCEPYIDGPLKIAALALLNTVDGWSNIE